MDALHQIEIYLILFFQSLGNWLITPMRLVSMLGNEEFFTLVMPSIYWCLDASLGIRVAAMLLLSNGLNSVVKLAFHAGRPYWIDARVKGYVAEGSFGIPSGHAQNAAGIWGLVAAANHRPWQRAGLVGIILLIGLSRIYLGVHFISDVLAGWLLGGLLLYLFIKAERPLVAWMQARSLAQMLSLVIITSILLVGMMLLPAALLSAWQIPANWIQNALASQPDTRIDPLNIDQVFTVAGTWLGFMVGIAWLYHHQGGFKATGTPEQRMLRYLIGVAGILIVWFGLGQVFPRNADILSYCLRFIRYTLVGLWVSALAPLLFARLGLAGPSRKEIPSLSSRENPL